MHRRNFTALSRSGQKSGDAGGHEEVVLIVSFVDALRQRGVSVSPEAVEELLRGTIRLGMHELHLVGRCTLVSRYSELEIYDETFLRFFGDDEPDEATPGSIARALPEPRMASEPVADRDERIIGAASALELLREKRFSECSEAELDELAMLMTRLKFDVPSRKTRRHKAMKNGRLDVQRTIKRSVRYGGEPFERKRRARSSRSRRVILIVDVSASMNTYTRMLMLFSHVVLRRVPGTEVFCFGTRLTRVTRSLRSDPRAVLDRVADVVFDRAAGTRIGESLERFLRDYGHRGLARGAVVLVCSDGLERGDPAVLGAQMRHLRRLAYRVIWLNPLKADPRYQPAARGMAAALPSVDLLVGGQSLRSLESLAGMMAESLRADETPSCSRSGSHAWTT